MRLSDPYQKEIAGTLWRELAEGRTLSKAMRLLPQYFAESSTFVIEAGEATGNLTPILAKIIAHLEEKREIRSKVVGSMTYPVFVGLVAIGVVLFFLFFLFPTNSRFISYLQNEMHRPRSEVVFECEKVMIPAIQERDFLIAYLDLNHLYCNQKLNLKVLFQLIDIFFHQNY